MPWDLNGNSLGANLTEWLGTRDAQPLIIGTQTGGAGMPTTTTEVMRLTAAANGRRVGIGTGTTITPQRKLHVEGQIHTGGDDAGLSFGNRLDPATGQSAPFTENPANGERWVWYASEGAARLWSGTNQLSIYPGGNLVAQGTISTQSNIRARRVYADTDVRVGQDVDVNDDVSAGGNVSGSHGDFNSTDANVTGVTGTSSTYYGVLGTASSRSGVRGESTSGTGVYGTGDRAWGVFGSSSTGYGVYGSSRQNPDGSGGTGIGVFGWSDDAAPGTFFTFTSGVWGHNANSGRGVYGYSVNGVGVHGQCQNYSTNVSDRRVGGLFEGGVIITNGLKPFTIDHPLDPENKYLVHTSVESSEMKNVYDGVARLDEDGAAWVDLPEWFEALNGDLRYQLTAVGGSAPNLHVAEEVSENRFKVAGGQAGMQVCWQVTGSRMDPWAAANPFEIEQEKSEEDRGRYLEPSLYDAPEEQRVMLGPIAEAGEEAQRPPEPSDIDFAGLEEEHRLS